MKLTKYRSVGIGLVFAVMLMLSLFWFSGEVEAVCNGCICPGNPCGLEPLPPIKPGIVPPKIGTTEYTKLLAESKLRCVGNGGTIIENKDTGSGMPTGFYCQSKKLKPGTTTGPTNPAAKGSSNNGSVGGDVQRVGIKEEGTPVKK